MEARGTTRPPGTLVSRVGLTCLLLATALVAWTVPWSGASVPMPTPGTLGQVEKLVSSSHRINRLPAALVPQPGT